MFRAFLLLLLLFPASALTSFAQEPAYLHYTIDEGLPSNEVYDVYEDHSGYIWFATDHGISRFDGYSFRNYSTGDGLVDNTVFGFHEDHNGRVWMRTFNSSLCYLDGERIQPYRHNAALRQFLGHDFIQEFAFDKKGNLWFFCIRKNAGLLRQDAVTGNIAAVSLPAGFSAFIRELDSGEFIAGVPADHTAAEQRSDTICFLDNTWLFHLPEQKRAQSRGIVRCRRRGPASWLFTYDSQLVVIDHGRIIHRAASALFNNCYVEPDGTLWSCGTGASLVDPSQARSRLLRPGDFVTDMLHDRMGNYWLTTQNNGVYLARNLQVGTLTQPLRSWNPGELFSLAVRNDQLFLLDHNGRIAALGLSPGGIDTCSAEVLPGSFGPALTFFISQQGDRLFLQQELLQLDDPHFTATTSPPSQPLLARSSVRQFAQRNDTVFIATNQRWLMADLDGHLLYSSQENGFTSFCTAIVPARGGGGVWIGAIDGLYFFDGKKTTPFEPGNPLFRQRVTAIVTGDNGEVFVSTRGSGLIVIDGTRRYNLRAKDGLSSDQCGHLCADGNVLWVCSNSGIDRVLLLRDKNGLSFRIERINTQHGLPSGMVNDVVRAGNFLYIATGKGLAWLDVSSFRLSHVPPPVYINRFLVNNRETDTTQALAWNDNNISIGFLALMYRNPGQVNYRYRLEGYEAAWNYTPGLMARYFNLPPGDYTFAVSAMNENGDWNLQPARLHFFIPAHYTQTAWFRVLLVLCVAGLISWIVFIFVRQQRDRARNTLALARAELKALRAQMKPHFIFNSLNSIQHFILEHDEEAAHFYLSRFSSLMRKTLDNSQQHTITLAREIETLELYLGLEKLRFGKNFEYKIDVAPALLPETIALPPMLLQPYVENAIWHGLLLLRSRDPFLQLRFYAKENDLVCVVEDNGIGRKKSAEQKAGRAHEPAGMKNTEERIAILNKVNRSLIRVVVEDLATAEGEPCGTRITLYILLPEHPTAKML